MTLEQVTLIVLLLVLGPWGVALVVALLRGYSLTITLTRRHSERDE
jgi:hypothetical protein